jgi:hypothetical protein
MRQRGVCVQQAAIASTTAPRRLLVNILSVILLLPIWCHVPVPASLTGGCQRHRKNLAHILGINPVAMLCNALHCQCSGTVAVALELATTAGRSHVQ